MEDQREYDRRKWVQSVFELYGLDNFEHLFKVIAAGKSLDPEPVAACRSAPGPASWSDAEREYIQINNQKGELEWLALPAAFPQHGEAPEGARNYSFQEVLRQFIESLQGQQQEDMRELFNTF